MKLVHDLKRHPYMARLSVFVAVAALIIGMVGCGGAVEYMLTILTTGGGSVTSPGVGEFTYDAGTVVNLVANPASGYYFVSWTGDVDTVADVTAANTTVTTNDNYVITANFAEGVLIRTWYDLDAVRSNLAGTYVLMNDLDHTTAGYSELAGPSANDAQGWVPIGGPTRAGIFVGTFDGQGHEIEGLFINRQAEDYVGLFGSANGTIKNIGIADLLVYSANFTGGLAGWNDGAVSNSYSTGMLNGAGYTGGLVGVNTGTVSNSYSVSAVTASWDVGGLVGLNELSGSTVTNSYSSGWVFAGSEVGGLVGVSTGAVSNSYSSSLVNGNDDAGGLVGMNAGTVSNSYSTGGVNGDTYVGGLVGLNGIGGTVSNSYCTGAVSGNTLVGGLVGRSAGVVSNSHCTGTVTGSTHTGGLVGESDGAVSGSCSLGSVSGTWLVGGLVGANEGSVTSSYSSGSVSGNDSTGGLVGRSDGTVSNSYSTGGVSGDDFTGGLVGLNGIGNVVSNSYSTGSVSGGNYTGGLVGLSYGTVTNSFWDTETSGQATSDGGTGKTTIEMKNIPTFSNAGWDIVSVADSGMRDTLYLWNIVNGIAYPFLSWQP
jgi:hypothetical protein